MCGESKRDFPVLVLLAPPGKYDWMFRQIVPLEDLNSSRENSSNSCPVHIQQRHDVCQSSYFKLFQ